MTKTDLDTAKELWTILGDIPINEEEEIETAFLHFSVGTNRYEIWHWFEDTFNITLAENDLVGV
jgi:hypothetical protein